MASDVLVSFSCFSEPVKSLSHLGPRAIALLCSSLVSVCAAENPPTLSAGYLARLQAAESATEQDAVLRAAPAGTSAAALRHQLLQRAYQLMIDGDYRRAQAFNDLVLRLSRAAGAGDTAAAADVQDSYLFREEGDLPGALDAVGRALSYYEAHPEAKHGLISAYQTQGLCYIAQSDFARALACYHHALSLAEETKDQPGIVSALNNIGEVYRTQGEPERALPFYEQARRTLADENAWNMAFLLNNIGICYDALGDAARAIDAIKGARAVAEKVRARPRVETSLAVLGDLEFKRGQLDAAQAYYEQSLQLANELHDVAGTARALLGGAQVALARHNDAAALAQAQQAVALARRTGEVDQLAPALTLAGQCLRALRREGEAARAFEEAIAAVERLRDRVAGGDIEREALLAQQIAPYRELTALLVRQKEPAQALTVAEQASARVLLDATGGGRANWSTLLTAEERARLQQLGLRLTEANRELSRAGQSSAPESALAAAEQAVRAAQTAEEDFAALVESSHPDLRRQQPPAALKSLAELAPALRGGKTAILRFVVGEEDSFLFVINLPNESAIPQLRVFSLGKGRAALARLADDYRGQLARRGLTWETGARQLYDLLLRPAAAALAGRDALVIVPDGPLWDVPFQTLEPAADHPLLLDSSVRYAPSLSLLARFEQAAPTAAAHPLLAFINPALAAAAVPVKAAVAERSWQPLPEMEKQADELAKIYPVPAREIFTGAAAREQTFKEKAGDAAILHFATHGVLDDRAPLYSYLLLSQVNVAPNEDGRLETRELLQLKLHARLAILCGCETARGQVTAGEGVVGLSWGFLVAGCPSTIVSQWKVDETTSTPLMIELHRQLHAGAANAEALRQASLQLRADPHAHHPFYWAPFVLMGADR